ARNAPRASSTVAVCAHFRCATRAVCHPAPPVQPGRIARRFLRHAGLSGRLPPRNWDPACIRSGRAGVNSPDLAAKGADERARWLTAPGQGIGRRPGGGITVGQQVNAASVEWNPTAERLRELTEKMPNASVTEFGNVNVRARVDSRSTRSTFIVEDSTNATKQTITRAEFDRIAADQDAYIAGSHMVVVDGYIGSDRAFRTRARLVMEAANANVAGMQQQLYYPAGDDYDPATWEPDTTVIYTPNLPARGYPNDRVIAVDLTSNVTRVLNSDYFGESKKGGLRMWNNIVYNRGGLALHAGC